MPIKFRADSKLAKAGLHAYYTATYNFNVEACIFGYSVLKSYYDIYYFMLLVETQGKSEVSQNTDVRDFSQLK